MPQHIGSAPIIGLSAERANLIRPVLERARLIHDPFWQSIFLGGDGDVKGEQPILFETPSQPAAIAPAEAAIAEGEEATEHVEAHRIQDGQIMFKVRFKRQQILLTTTAR
jgi:hypothetical protein